MDRLHLYGDSRSGNCYKAAWILRLSGTPFEWVETDVLRKDTRTPDFLALNPNGKVPLLVWPDGRVLSESNAMLLHLSRQTPYFPDDPWQQALVWQWLFFEQYSHEPYIAVMRFIVSVARRQDQEAARIPGLLERGYHALAVMERRLSRAGFFAGERFTVADMALFAYTHTAEEGGFELQEYPQVRSWLERVTAEPAFLPMPEACRSYTA